MYSSLFFVNIWIILIQSLSNFWFLLDIETDCNGIFFLDSFLVRTEQFRTTALSLLSPYPTQNLEILDRCITDQESLTENPEQV